jgi:predicted metal-dependent hydrolase
LEERIGNYNIVYELLHLCYPNHGRVCKDLITAYQGDSQKNRKELEKDCITTKSKIVK